MSLVFWWNILPTIQVTLWSNQEWSGKPAFCFWNPRFFLSITIITLQYVLSLIVTYELLSLLKFTHLRWFTKIVTSTKKIIFIFLIAWSHLTSDELTACHRCLADHRPIWRGICWCTYDDRRDLGVWSARRRWRTVSSSEVNCDQAIRKIKITFFRWRWQFL